MDGQGLRATKREATRRALAQAAFTLATEHGMRGTTVEDIAHEVGVAPRTFFNYYTCKEDAVTSLVLHRATAALDTWTPPEHAPVLEIVRRLVAHHLDAGTVDALVAESELAREHPQLLPYLRDVQLRMWLAAGERVSAALEAPTDDQLLQVQALIGALHAVATHALMAGAPEEGTPGEGASEEGTSERKVPGVESLRERLVATLTLLESGIGSWSQG